MNKKVFWVISACLTGWLLLNVILSVMNKEQNNLYLTLPGLLAGLGWVYAEYRIEWRD